MDWNEAMEEERRMLRRIATLLFALAGIADRLCSRPAAVHGFVLWLLRLAEDVGREFVIETAEEYGAAMPPPSPLAIPRMRRDDSAADAARLALSLRALAILLDGLADQVIVCRVSQVGYRTAGGTWPAARIARTLSDTVLGWLAGAMSAPTQGCPVSAIVGAERRDSS